MDHIDLAADFVTYARAKLARQLAQIVRCARLLSEREIWHRANGHCNSVGNLILHLTGNVRQWIVSGVGGESFARDRQAEFAQQGPLPTASLLASLEDTLRKADDVLARLNAATLAEPRTIQGYEVSTLVAVFHVVEHFSGHAGQIVHMVKALRDVDVSLYDAAGHQEDRRVP